VPKKLREHGLAFLNSDHENLGVALYSEKELRYARPVANAILEDTSGGTIHLKPTRLTGLFPLA